MEGEELEGNRTSFKDAIWIGLTNERPARAIDENSAGEEEDICSPLRQNVSDDVKDEEDPVSKENEMSAHKIKLATKAMSLDTATGKLRFGIKPRTPTSQAMISRRYFLQKLKAELRMSLDIPDDSGNADKYMYGVLYLCTAMFLWKHKWILQILSIPVVYYMIKRFGGYFGFWSIMSRQWGSIVASVQTWCAERQLALVPAFVRGLYKIYLIIERLTTNALRGSVDAVATTAVILGLLVFTFCASVFITVQVR